MAQQTLHLRITNMTSLPDGGPLEATAAPGEILEIGRDSGIGWSLPDPRRFISGRHLEVRYENGGWWLYDISTNGTFVNGASSRVKSPHSLQSGDRLQVGHYSVEVTLDATADGETPAIGSAAPQAGTPPPADIWGASSGGVQVSEPQASPPPQQPPADIWGTGSSGGGVAGGPAQRPRPSVQPLPGGAGGSMPPGPQPGPAPTPNPAPHPAPPSGEGRAAPFAQQQAGPQPQQQPSTDAVLAQIAAAAGLPEGSLSQGNPMETATEIGRALNALSEELSSLLQARAVARRSVRSGQVTMIGREDNNPLKFMPTPDQALSAMFGPPRPGFQRGGEAVRAAFADIKRHQYATHAAIQPALARLLDDLAPETIEARVRKSGLLSNRRAKAWDTFVERWDAKAQAHDNGMLDVFLTYFAEAYDTEGGG